MLNAAAMMEIANPEITKRMLRERASADNPNGAADQLATVAIARIPDKIRHAVAAYGMENFTFVSVHFKNGHVIRFDKDWKSFVAGCILVYDLPPRDDADT
jgi:hypothetical protein